MNKVSEETRKSRRAGLSGTAEYFTPEDLVKHMCDKILLDANETQILDGMRLRI